MAKNQFNLNIVALQIDVGTEFKPLIPHLLSHGIKHRVSYPYTPQQNGSVERKNCHIVEVGLSLLAHSSIPKKFWPYAFHTAVHLINRLPTLVLSNNTPY